AGVQTCALPIYDARNHLRFDRITQPGLRALTKRWARLRLSSGITVATVLNDVAALTRVSAVLAHSAPPAGRPRPQRGPRHRRAPAVVRDPPTRLGRHPAHHRGVLRRRHPAPPT